MTLPQGQFKAWGRWEYMTLDLPTCYNRPAFDWVGKPGCSAWFTGGNATVRPHGDDKGGKTFPWTACDGCARKAESDAG